MVVLPWLVLEITGSATAAGGIAAATLVPVLLSSLVVGTFIDMVGRKRVALLAHPASLTRDLDHAIDALAALPDTTTPLYQITPGLAKLLDTKQDPNTTGLIASQQVAETLGTSTGGTIGLADGRTARVKGIYQYPDDGRTPGYAYALMEETPATGTFDACWAKTWPQTEDRKSVV